MLQEAVVEEKPSEFQKLNTLFNEEIYIRVDASNVPVTKFKISDMCGSNLSPLFIDK